MSFREICLFEKIREKINLYGWRIALLVSVKAFMRKFFAFTWDKYCLMVRETDDLPLLDFGKFQVRDLSISDYENELWEPSFLNEEKKKLYVKRFANPNAKAYGVIVDGELAYSTWILYGEVIIQNRFRYPLSNKVALLLDSYTHPKYRGMGLHNYMNVWRLYKMKEKGVEKVFGVVLSYNRPAIKTQTKSGLRVVDRFYIFGFGNKKWCTLKKIPI